MQEKMVANVKQKAQEANLSIRELERRCGFHYGIIQRWDEHLPSIDKVCKVAKVLGAIGFTARGILSFGLCSIGVISFGVVSLGLLAMGALGLGILASGSIAVGIFACGGIAVGIASFGGISIADFAVGGLAIGKYFAYGDYAQGMHALGITEAIGECFEHLGELTAERKEVLISSMYENVPKIFHWIISLIAKVI